MKNDINMYLQSIDEYRWKIKNAQEREIPSYKIDIKNLKEKISQGEWAIKSVYGSERVRWEFELSKLQDTLSKKEQMLKTAEENINIYGLKLNWFDSKIKLLKLQLDSEADEIRPLARKVEELTNQVHAIEHEIEEIDALRRTISHKEGLILLNGFYLIFFYILFSYIEDLSREKEPFLVRLIQILLGTLCKLIKLFLVVLYDGSKFVVLLLQGFNFD